MIDFNQKIIKIKKIIAFLIICFLFHNFSFGQHKECDLQLIEQGTACTRTFIIDVPSDWPPIAYNITWDFGDGTIINSSDLEMVHTFCTNEQSVNVVVNIQVTNNPLVCDIPTILNVTVANLPASCANIPYQIQTDLIACTTANDYGFIQITTLPGSTVQWQFDPDNALQKYDANTGVATLFNALPGQYTVTISNGGCTPVSEPFTIYEECCSTSCETPTNLRCAINFPDPSPNPTSYSSVLTWDPVQGAIGYEIQIIPAHLGGCDCASGLYILKDPMTIQVNDNSWEMKPGKLRSSCFAWKVIVTCENGAIEESEFKCYNGGCS